MSRDVDRADWTVFAKALLPRRPQSDTTQDSSSSNEDEDARRQKLTEALREWNKTFFEPRGLNVVAQFGDDVVDTCAVASEGHAQEDEKADANGNKGTSRGYGLKLGKSMLGVSSGPNSHGYGLRLGGVLLGVRVDNDEK